MFRRVRFISVTSALFVAIALAVAALSSFSSPHGTAHADHTSRPTVSIKSIMPEVGEEGRSVTVTLALSRQLTADEKFCYNDVAPSDPNARKDRVCVEGGLKVRDNYNDHLNEEGRNPYDKYIKFIFYGSQVEDRLTVGIPDDECITPDRQLQIWIATEYQDRDEYPDERKHGYDIDTTDHYVQVIGNDDDDDPNDLWETFDSTKHDSDSTRTCAPVESGATEDGTYNRAPLFGDAEETLDVDENTVAGEPIGDPITATDPESDTLTYSLQGQDSSSFSIDSSTGQIRTKDPLDHETKDTYHLAMFVRDSKDIRGNADSADDNSIDVTITVTDVNEPPAFDANAPTSLSVEEGTATDTDIGSPFTAADPDDGDTVTYSLDDGDGAAFDIDSSGQIKTKDTLDRETKSSYSVTVTATDGDLTATHAVTITVGDVNDAPAFEDDQGDVLASTTREVAENTAAGTNIGAPVSATDDDDTSLTYTLGGTDAGSFDIDGSTGQLKTKAALDYESGTTSYSVTVSVTDGKDDSGNAETPAVVDASIAVTINVTDVNEPPSFADDAPATLSVDEGTGSDTNITGGLFTATDPENDDLTYSLGGAGAIDFAIDTSTGQLKTRSIPHHENQDSYSITIQVTDGKAADGTAETTATIDDTLAVTINVNEVAEWDLLRLDKVARVGAPVNAQLLDRNRNFEVIPTWNWEISPNGTDQWTPISADTSIIPNASSSSYTPVQADLGKYLRVTVTYEAADATSKTLSKQVPRPVAGNNAPEFSAETDTREVAENTKRNRPIGAPVTATDDDDGDGDELTYSLSGTDASSFDIDMNSGQIKTKSALHYEDKDSYTVTITVTDLASATDTIDVTITVTDVNEKPAFDANAPATQTVDENTATDTAIGDAYTATDPDNAGSDPNKDTLTYSLAGTDAASFDIDTTSGQLKTKADLDHETKASYSVTIRVTDGKADDGAAESTATIDDSHAVTITVTDVDEDGAITLSADPPSAGTKLTATLTDDDGVKATPAVAWKWEISPDGTNSWTTIPGETTNSYTPGADDVGDYLQVTATYDDEKGTGKTAEKVSKAVLTAPPTNRHPEFADSATTRSVPENTASNTNIGAPVSATHADSKGTLKYTLSGTDATSFAIDTTTGQLKTQAALDFEDKDEYTVTVSVSDELDNYEAADTVNDDSITVTITVTDVNEGAGVRLQQHRDSRGCREHRH